MIAVYDRPENEDKFLDHYRNVHAPLARAMPDLKDFQWGRCVDPAGGTPDKFVVATLDWASAEVALASIGSPAGQKGTDDLANFAQAGVTVLTVEVEE